MSIETADAGGRPIRVGDRVRVVRDHRNAGVPDRDGRTAVVVGVGTGEDDPGFPYPYRVSYDDPGLPHDELVHQVELSETPASVAMIDVQRTIGRAVAKLRTIFEDAQTEGADDTDRHYGRYEGARIALGLLDLAVGAPTLAAEDAEAFLDTIPQEGTSA